VFESKVLGVIFGTKRAEMIEGWIFIYIKRSLMNYTLRQI
jgi:hypothetical protein